MVGREIWSSRKKSPLPEGQTHLLHYFCFQVHLCVFQVLSMPQRDRDSLIKTYSTHASPLIPLPVPAQDQRSVRLEPRQQSNVVTAEPVGSAVAAPAVTASSTAARRSRSPRSERQSRSPRVERSNQNPRIDNSQASASHHQPVLPDPIFPPFEPGGAAVYSGILRQRMLQAVSQSQTVPGKRAQINPYICVYLNSPAAPLFPFGQPLMPPLMPGLPGLPLPFPTMGQPGERHIL